MWIFNCDRCNREDINYDDGKRVNGEYTATVTVKLKTPNTSSDIINEAAVKYELCHECYNNFDWWLQKIDVIIPLISTPPGSPIDQSDHQLDPQLDAQLNPQLDPKADPQIERIILETAPTLIPELTPK